MRFYPIAVALLAESPRTAAVEAPVRSGDVQRLLDILRRAPPHGGLCLPYVAGTAGARPEPAERLLQEFG